MLDVFFVTFVEQIFIIMHDGPPDHWYLLYVDMLQGGAEIWDTKFVAKKKTKQSNDCVTVVSFTACIEYACFIARHLTNMNHLQ